jgi:hypothetical protein
MESKMPMRTMTGKATDAAGGESPADAEFHIFLRNAYREYARYVFAYLRAGELVG